KGQATNTAPRASRRLRGATSMVFRIGYQQGIAEHLHDHVAGFVITTHVDQIGVAIRSLDPGDVIVLLAFLVLWAKDKIAVVIQSNLAITFIDADCVNI